MPQISLRTATLSACPGARSATETFLPLLHCVCSPRMIFRSCAFVRLVTGFDLLTMIAKSSSAFSAALPASDAIRIRASFIVDPLERESHLKLYFVRGRLAPLIEAAGL